MITHGSTDYVALKEPSSRYPNRFAKQPRFIPTSRPSRWSVYVAHPKGRKLESISVGNERRVIEDLHVSFGTI